MSKWICNSCGTENDSDAKFCKNCGTKFTSITEEPTPIEESKPAEESAPMEEPTPVPEEPEKPEDTKTSDEALKPEAPIEAAKPASEPTPTESIPSPKKKGFNKKLLIPIGIVVAIIIFLLATSGPKVVGVAVMYDGDTQEGIVIDENNSGLVVWGVNDKDEDVEISGWTVKEPVTLVADETAIVTVLYEDFVCEVDVTCSTSKVASMEASYSGPTEAGTVIDSSSDIEVTATHVDGSVTEDFDGWEVKEPITLAADEKSKVEIVFEDITTEIEVQCSTYTLLEISASYDGDTSKGAVLNEKNEGITVVGKYKDGSTKEIKGFTVEKPATLEAGKTSKVKIKYEDKECSLKVECTTLSEKQYKDKCKSIPYEDLARNPDKYDGQYIKFTGKVVQTIEDDYLGALRVNVTKGSYGHYEDTVYVIYLIDKENRILEDDIVDIYGTSSGLYSYESVMGATITIPSMYASYVELN